MNRVKKWAIRKPQTAIITIVNWWEDGTVSEGKIYPNGIMGNETPLPRQTRWNPETFEELHEVRWDEQANQEA